MVISTGLGLVIGLVAIAIAIVVAASIILIAASRIADSISANKHHVMSHRWNVSYSDGSPEKMLLPALLCLINQAREYLNKKSK